MAGAKLKTEIVSTGADTFIKDTKKCKDEVAGLKSESDKCTKSLNNKSNAERRALMEVRKHQQELKKATKEAKEFKNKCNDISGTLNNFTSKLGLNVNGLGSFATKLGIAGAACGAVGVAMSKLISSNDDLNDSFTILKNQIGDVWDGLFRIGSADLGSIWKQSANVSRAFDDMETNVPLIEAQLKGVTFQYNEELALAQDINIEEGERLKHLANAKGLLIEMNRLELKSIEFRQKYAKEQLNLNYKKSGGKGELTADDVNNLIESYTNGTMESFVNNLKYRYDDLKGKQIKQMAVTSPSTGVTTYVKNPQYKELSDADKQFMSLYEKYKAFLKLIQDEEMAKGLISFIDVENEKTQLAAAQAEQQKTLSKVDARIKATIDRKNKADAEAAKRKKELDDADADRQKKIAKAEKERIDNLKNQMEHLQSKKQNMQALGLDTADIDETIALLDEKMAKEGIEGAGEFAKNFKQKLEDELKKINPSFSINVDMSVSDASDLFSGVLKNLPKEEAPKPVKAPKTPKVDMSSVDGIRDAMKAWSDYYDTLEELAEGNADRLTEIAEERAEKETELATNLKDKQKQNVMQTIDAYAQMVGAIGGFLGTLADKEEEGSDKQKKLKKAEFSMNLAMALAQGVASAMRLTFPENIAAAISTAATVATMFAKMPKFASGGIIGGSSTIGDHLVARVNSGEMVLNNRQQKRLFSLLNNNGIYSNQTQTQKVVFEIKGKDLKGTLDNFSRKYRTSI